MRRTYTLAVDKGQTTLCTEAGTVLCTIDRAVDATDLVYLMIGSCVNSPAPAPAPPARLASRRWIERIAIVAVTAVLVYRYGADVMWWLTDTTDHLVFYYGSRP